MKYLTYIFRNVRRNPVRTILTVASMAICLFLTMTLLSFFAIYDEARVLAHLGDALVRSLQRVDVRRIGSETLANWRDTWLEVGGGHAELEMPLRIVRVGIEYLIRSDEKVLLDLVTVERKILRQALGLGEADGVA